MFMFYLLPLIAIFCIQVPIEFFVLKHEFINNTVLQYNILFSFLTGLYLDYLYYQRNKNNKVMDDDDIID